MNKDIPVGKKMTDKEKIAQIIAEHLCPQGKTHKRLYGSERMCYSNDNFAECEKVSECVDALIAAGIGDVAEWKAIANDWKQRFESRDKQYNDGIVSSCKALQLKDEKLQKYKRRAEVAERALFTACVNLIKDEDNVNMELLAHVVYTKFLRKAERELSEERKDD